MDITAAVARGAGEAFSIEKLTLEAPREGEIQVRILGVGLCHSDILARDGTIPVQLPAVFGHEGAGQVIAVGDGASRHKVGDMVLLTFGFCGQCARCDGGDAPYCEQSGLINYSGGRPDGTSTLSAGGERIGSNFFAQSSFADHVIALENNAIPIPAGLPVELMGPLGCGVQTGAGAIMNTLRCKAASSLLITGGGSLGLSAVLAAVVQGCTTIIVSEPHEARRQLALELGATHAIDPGAGNLAESVRTIVPAGVDYIFDSTAVPTVISAAIASLGMRGKLALAGVPKTPDTSVPLPLLQMVALGQTIVGEVEGDSDPHEFLPRLMALHAAGRFPFDKLLRTYRLSDINQAVSDHHAGVCVKAVLLPDAS